MTTNAATLRETLEAFRKIADDSAEMHAALARVLARPDLPESDRVAVRALAGIQDCMARRYRQWAAQLEVAILDAEELAGG